MHEFLERTNRRGEIKVTWDGEGRRAKKGCGAGMVIDQFYVDSLLILNIDSYSYNFRFIDLIIHINCVLLNID